MPKPLYAHVWCLICESSPAAGTLVRITPNGEQVPLAEDEKTPHVCLGCGKQHSREKGKPFNGFSTLWRFRLYAPEQASQGFEPE